MSRDAIAAALRVGGELDCVREAALLNYGKPQPHLDVVPSGYGIRTQARESNSCPCPECYDIRMATWTSTR